MPTLRPFPRLLPALCLLFLALGGLPAHAAQNALDRKRALIEELKKLSVEDLVEVEVSLDEVFDIFDSLVTDKKTTLATGTEQSTVRAPAVTSVITAQDIEAIGARDLDEVLESVPGLHVNRRYLAYNPVYSIRGMYSDPQVLMLINGMPINSVYTGGRSYIWGGMPVNAIARIEIIRGPGSAVFGADAFAGVINIITKTRDDIEGTEAGARVGNLGHRDLWLLHGDKWAGLDVAASVEYHRGDSNRETVLRDAQTRADQALAPFGVPPASQAPGALNLNRDNLDARVDLAKGDWRLRLGYQAHRDTGLGISPYQTLDPGAQHDDDRISADLTYHNPLLIENWDLTAQISYLEMITHTSRDQRLLPRGATLLVDTPQGPQFVGYPEGLIFNGTISERQTRLSFSGFYSGWSGHKVRAGFGYYFGDLYKIEHFTNIDPASGAPIAGLADLTDTPYAFSPEKTRFNWHAFVQDTWALHPDWELTAGLRYDNYSDFGDTFNPRLALVWEIRPDLSAKLLYGRAFRAPSFVELYNNTVLVGNADLEAETIDTGELAFTYYASERLHLALNLFRYQWRDGIRYSLVADSVYQPFNQGEQTGRGFELEARWKLTPKLSLLANYAYQHSVDEADREVSGVPKQSAYLRNDWLLFPNWYLDTQVNWIGKRGRAPNDIRPPLEGYTTLDLTLRRKNIRAGRWNVALGIRNLFDSELHEPGEGPDASGAIALPDDLPLPGRQYFVELRYHF